MTACSSRSQTGMRGGCPISDYGRRSPYPTIIQCASPAFEIGTNSLSRSTTGFVLRTCHAVALAKAGELPAFLKKRPSRIERLEQIPFPSTQRVSFHGSIVTTDSLSRRQSEERTT